MRRLDDCPRIYMYLVSHKNKLSLRRYTCVCVSVLIYVHHICASYMCIIYVHHICASYMCVIYVHHYHMVLVAYLMRGTPKKLNAKGEVNCVSGLSTARCAYLTTTAMCPQEVTNGAQNPDTVTFVIRWFFLQSTAEMFPLSPDCVNPSAFPPQPHLLDRSVPRSLTWRRVIQARGVSSRVSLPSIGGLDQLDQLDQWFGGLGPTRAGNLSGIWGYWEIR